MEFRTFFVPSLKLNVLIAEGPIVAGDAERFTAWAPKADRDSEGHIILVLDSPGGSVPAAFELVKAMDRVGVFTLVPDNALCASACASIIYPAGIRRDIVGTGRLGFHSCYRRSGRAIEESSLCNEVIANHAISRGLAHSSVSLFVQDFGAMNMAWVDRNIACSMLPGMCKPTLRENGDDSKRLVSPSFDCGRAETRVERLICTDSNLAQLDVRMSIAYFTLRANSADRDTLLREQRAWLRVVRNACSDSACLSKEYLLRINALGAPSN